MATFAGEEPAVDHIGWGVAKDMKVGLKEDKDGNNVAPALNTESQ